MKRILNLSCFLIALGLLCYTVLRAFNLSFTHDESFSYLYCSRDSFMEIISNRTTVISSNNHILNTLCMKLFGALFGCSELALRLQSILAHIAYLSVTFLLLRRSFQSHLLVLCGFLLLNVNPYLLEFFSLARGYALAIAFMLTGIYWLIRYMKSGKQKHLVFMLAATCLAVISNFGLFYFFAAILLVHQVFLLSRYKNLRVMLIKSKPVFIMLLLMLAFCYEPMRKMVISHQFTFGGMEGFWNDTVMSSLYAYLNNEMYQCEPLIVTTIQAIILSALIIYSLVLICKLFKNTFSRTDRNGAIFTVFLWSIVVINCIMHVLVKSPFINDRFALFIVPLFMFVLIFLLEWLISSGIAMKVAGYAFAVSIAAAMGYHFSRCANSTHTMNWRYDASTKTMLNDLIADKERSGKATVHLGATWLFEPGINFYRVTRKLDWLQEITRDGLKQGDDYLYVEKGDFVKADSLQKVVMKYYAVSETRLLK